MDDSTIGIVSNVRIAQIEKDLNNEATALEILAKFRPMVFNALTKQEKYKNRRRSEHAISKSLLPNDFNNWKPLVSTGDGNCLYNSISILLLGNESLSSILRLLTAAEMIGHADFYAKHPQLSQSAKASGYSMPAIISIFLSDDEAQQVYNGNLKRLCHAIKFLAKKGAKSFVFSSPFHILALSTVIAKPIFSVYPDITTSSVTKKALHGLFYPRESVVNSEISPLQEDDFLAIMWTRLTRIALHGWTPNHFVPIVKSFEYTNPTKTYTNALKSGFDLSQKCNHPTSTSSQSSHVKVNRKKQKRSAFHFTEPFQESEDSVSANIPDKKYRNLSNGEKHLSNENLASTIEIIDDLEPSIQSGFPSDTDHVPMPLNAELPCSKTEDPSCRKNDKHQFDNKNRYMNTKKEHKYINNCVDTPSQNVRKPRNDFPRVKTCRKKRRHLSTQTKECTAKKEKKEEGSIKAKNSVLSYFTPKKNSNSDPKYEETSTVTPTIPVSNRIDIANDDEANLPLKNCDKGNDKPSEGTPAIPASNSDDVASDDEDVLPLKGPNLSWYFEKGVNCLANVARTEARMNSRVVFDDCRRKALVRGCVSGNLFENTELLFEKLKAAGSTNQQNHLSAMLSLARHLMNNGCIIPTQELAKMYKELKGLKESTRVESSRMIEILSKHLNVAQVYIAGKGYTIENHGEEVMKLLDSVQDIEKSDESIVRQKVQEAVGNSYTTIIDYLDSKRDRDTLKAVLTKITSTNFMANLANVKDKRTFKRSKDIVTKNMQVFDQMKSEIDALDTSLSGEALRRKKYRTLQKMKLTNLRHVFQGRGRELKSEEFQDLAAILEYAFGEGDRID